MESTTDFRAVRAEPVERDPKQTLTGHEIEAELLADWRIMFGTLQARFRTGDFATGLRLVQEIGAAAEEMNHHPDLDLRYPTVHVRLSSHDVGGLTQRDVDLARRISQTAPAGWGRRPTPTPCRCSRSPWTPPTPPRSARSGRPCSA